MTYGGQGWRANPSSSKEMFDVFLIMRQLHEICWYLYETSSFDLPTSLIKKVQQLLAETERVTEAPPCEVLSFDLFMHHSRVSSLLRDVSEHIRDYMRQAQAVNVNAILNTKQKKEFIAADLRKKELRCTDFRGCLLIATNLEEANLSGADFIGADLRDANLRGANLSQSIFLTQSQINGAKGDSRTLLPSTLLQPPHWL